MNKTAKGTMPDGNLTRRAFLKTTGSLLLAGPVFNTLSGCVPQEASASVYLKRFSGGKEIHDNYPVLQDAVKTMVQTLYEEKPFFSTGDSVSIKVNIVATAECLGLPAAVTYTTHPRTVQALAEAFIDLGAGRITLVEGSTMPSDSMEAFAAIGYDAVASYLGAGLIDLNGPAPHSGFQEAALHNGRAFSSISAHRHLFETDCLVSAAKLKMHNMAGVSLSLKNLIGLMPIQVYGRNATGSRTPYVHVPDAKTQIPGSIVDLARLFPVDFSFIDGISTIAGGEGPWVPAVSFEEPGLLIASADPVAADAVACVSMGLDPGAVYPASPFSSCENHLHLAARYGLGVCALERITIVGDMPDTGG